MATKAEAPVKRPTAAQRREAHLSLIANTSRKHIDELLEDLAQLREDLAVARAEVTSLEGDRNSWFALANHYQDHLRRHHAAVTRYIEALTGGDEGQAGAALFWLGAQHAESRPQRLAGIATGQVAPKERGL